MRVREVLREAQYGGRNCPPQTQLMTCGAGDCAVLSRAAAQAGAEPLTARPPATSLGSIDARGRVRAVQTFRTKQHIAPAIVYGTAWKKHRTAKLTLNALKAGYRAIDTANQAKHYREAGVGAAVAQAIKKRIIRSREDVFLQTKFSHGQWRGSVLGFTQRVQESVKQSLAHLRTTYVNALLLHGPTNKRVPRLPAADWEVWRALEAAYDAGITRSLGVSNVNVGQLLELLRDAKVKPEYVQKRTFARNGWEREMRTVCREHGVIFQGYMLLKLGNMQHPVVQRVARKHGKTAAQVIFRFARHIGIVPVMGSSSEQHLAQDLDALNFDLTDDEVRDIESMEE